MNYLLKIENELDQYKNWRELVKLSKESKSIYIDEAKLSIESWKIKLKKIRKIKE